MDLHELYGAIRAGGQPVTIHQALAAAIELSGRRKIDIAREVFAGGVNPAAQLCNLLAGRRENPGSDVIRRMMRACGVVFVPDGDVWQVERRRE
jgi:hypothetical protein